MSHCIICLIAVFGSPQGQQSRKVVLEPLAIYVMAKRPMETLDANDRFFQPQNPLLEYREFKDWSIDSSSQFPEVVDPYVFVRNTSSQRITADIVHVYDVLLGTVIHPEGDEPAEWEKMEASARWEDRKFTKRKQGAIFPPGEVATIKLDPFELHKVTQGFLRNDQVLMSIRIVLYLECDECDSKKRVSSVITVPWMY